VECSADLVRAEVDKILASVSFARNDRLSAFLRFIVDQELSGKGDQLKESILGVEVFGRRPDYDVRRDSVVRTEAGKLRDRLTRYYAAEGAADSLVIELPHKPIYRQTKTAPSRSRLGYRWLVLGVAAIALGTLAWWRFHQNEPIPIAVLPLINLSQDPANDYFSDGLTGEIIRNLSIIDGLAVRSQTSSFVFKGKTRSVHEAGKQLDVEYILEGSVFRAGQQLRINVQLVRVHDDFPLWAGKYDREATDIFGIQDEISRGIVNSLRLKLGRGRRRYETSAEAYDVYVRGRAFETRPGLSGMREAIPRFEETIVKDPSFAPAYAGLAVAYGALSGYDRFDQAERADQVSKMRAAAERAIQLDPS
jgi:TolB-like protein